MPFEELNGLGVLASYGARVTDGKWGALTGDDIVKHAVYEVDAADLSSLTITTALHGTTGLDLILPAGSSLIRCRFIVETAFVGPTAIVAGTYSATNGTTVINTTGLMNATVGVVTALDAVGDVVDGTGTQLTTGTGAANGALLEAAVIRFLPTGAVATAGRMKVYVSYIVPTP